MTGSFSPDEGLEFVSVAGCFFKSSKGRVRLFAQSGNSF